VGYCLFRERVCHRPRDKAVDATWRRTFLRAKATASQCTHESFLKISWTNEGSFRNSLWRHSSCKRKQLTSNERSPLGRQECRGRSAVCTLRVTNLSSFRQITGRFRQPTSVVGKFGFFVDTATLSVQVPRWSFLRKLVLGLVIFECKRHYFYDDEGDDNDNLVTSPFSSLSNFCSDVSPYDVPVHWHVAVANDFGSDFGSIEDRSGSSFLQEVCHAPPCVMYTPQLFEVGTSAVSAKTNK